MSKSLGLLLLLSLSLSAAACSTASDGPTTGSVQELRGLSKDEALSELNQLGDALHAYYGPLEYKKQRFGFDLDQALAVAKGEIEQGQTEGDRIRPMYELLSKLHDGHVALTYKLRSDQSGNSSIPLIVTPVEDKLLVAGVAPTLGISRGDALVSIDGMTTQQLEDIATPLSEIGTPESTRHFAAVNMTQREFYFPPSLQPQGATAHVTLQKADGTQYSVDVPWRSRPGGLAGMVTAPTAAAPTNPGTPSAQATFAPHAAYILEQLKEFPHASLLEFGEMAPFWLTAQVKQQFNLIAVTPKTATLTTLGVTIPTDPQKAADYIHIAAFKYKYGGKNVLLVRIPEFIVPQNNYDENVAWLAALLKDNMTPPAAGEAPNADVLVVDVTHNPGGSVPYVQGLVSLLTTHAIPNMVEQNHADRRWVQEYLDDANATAQYGADVQAILKRMQTVEQAMDANKWLAPFMPMAGEVLGPTVDLTAETAFGTEMIDPHPQVAWNKPLLVLHDELSGSGGDAFPTLLKNGGFKTFGATTMGLGGNVEENIVTLPYSGGTLNLTRGLMGPYAADGNVKLIENNGCTPTIPYAHTIADFRAGFPAYVTAFSKAVTTM